MIMVLTSVRSRRGRVGENQGGGKVDKQRSNLDQDQTRGVRIKGQRFGRR